MQWIKRRLPLYGSSFSAKKQLLRVGPKTLLYNTVVGGSLFARGEKKAF
jgi:hypothetical protein